MKKIKFFVSVQYKVNCDNDYMTVDVKKTDDIKSIYLNQMKFYPGNILLLLIYYYKLDGFRYHIVLMQCTIFNKTKRKC